MMVLHSLQAAPSDTIHQLFFRETIGHISMDLIVIDMLKSNVKTNKVTLEC